MTQDISPQVVAAPPAHDPGSAIKETLEDYPLRFAPRHYRRWSTGVVAVSALGGIAYLADFAIGANIGISYGTTNALWGIAVFTVVGASVRSANSRSPWAVIVQIADDTSSPGRDQSSSFAVKAHCRPPACEHPAHWVRLRRQIFFPAPGKVGA